MRCERSAGFTLIELLIVIAIIGILSTIGIVSLNYARARARDSVRLQDMHNIELALQTYYYTKGEWPVVGSSGKEDFYDGCPQQPDGELGGEWDRSNNEADGDGWPFIEFLDGTNRSNPQNYFFPNGTPLDPLNWAKGDGCWIRGKDFTYVYYKKPSGYVDCKPTGEYFYLLGISDLETSNGTHSSSPGCPCGSWIDDWEWFSCWPPQEKE